MGFSAIEGSSLPPSALAQLSLPPGTRFFATGVSLVLHPRNPHVPTVHMNIRYFEAGEAWWFGGGIDLTPYYPVEAEVVGFHRALKGLCLPTAATTPPGSGPATSISSSSTAARPAAWAASSSITCGATARPISPSSRPWAWPSRTCTVPSWRPQVAAFTGRRSGSSSSTGASRYVEFNLLYDRGTLFGLQSGGRTESILMSMPPLARWEYGYQPAPGSAEERLTGLFPQTPGLGRRSGSAALRRARPCRRRAIAFLSSLIRFRGRRVPLSAAESAVYFGLTPDRSKPNPGPGAGRPRSVR